MLSSPPNLLTVSRVLLVPVLVALFYVEGDWARWFACLVFVVAATTDYLDGYMARAWAMQSPFGRWLDPVADKLLVGATVVMLVGFDRAPLLPALVIVLREIMVSGLREYMAEVRAGLPVSRLAKWKTAIQMTALGFLIVGDAGFAFLPVRLIGEILLWIAVTLTLVTGYAYFRAAFGALLSGRPRRARPVPKVGKQATLPG